MDQNASKLEDLISRLETTTVRLEAMGLQGKPSLGPKPTNIGGGGAASGGSGEAPPTVKQFDEIVGEPLEAFLASCNKIGGEVGEIAKSVKSCFDLHREFIWSAAGQKEPAGDGLQKLMEPMIAKIGQINNTKNAKKGTPIFNHYSAVAEGLPALGWVTVKPTPGPYVKEMLDASLFYINRVRTENKGNAAQADWATAWCEVFTALQKYIRQHHTTGLVWNSSPGSIPSKGNGVPKAGGGGPPAAPPPPPSNLLAGVVPSCGTGGASSADRQALFAEINKGEKITSGLKKVTDDMKTHKNPNLRAGSTVPAAGGKAASAGQPAAAAAAPKPPNIYLKDQKVWNVEYQKGNRNIQLQTDKKQAVYIFKCEDTVVQIKGKVNSISIDSCKKTSVVFEDLLAQVEVINSKSIEVQTLGSMPTISIQKTDGCQVYLSEKSLNAEIVTSKSSEMNILVPKANGELAEYPVPEQFKTVLSKDAKKLETTISDIV